MVARAAQAPYSSLRPRSPEPVKRAMRIASRVMTAVAYRI